MLKYAGHDDVKGGSPPLGHCRILVIGVGEAGNNVVTRLRNTGISGAECIAVNKDPVYLSNRRTSGGDLKLELATIEKNKKRIEDLLAEVDITFITAGLEGGTETGVAPVIAEIARRKGAVTVGLVAVPFRIEKGRLGHAAQALTEMRRKCDTVVVIDHNKLLQLVSQLPGSESSGVGDQFLANMIKGITETISTPSLINLDFADFKNIVRRSGVAVVGVGESDAPNRAEEAVKNALASLLLDIDYAGATGALVFVSGDNQMTIEEANRVGEVVTEVMDDNASVMWGARVNPELDGVLGVTLLMTGGKSSRLLSGLGTIAPQLFNMEPYVEPERSLDIDLNLYQMENFQ